MAVFTALAAACAGSATPPVLTDQLTVTADAASIKVDGTKANLTVACLTADAKPGTGSVVFTAPFGDVNGQGLTATVAIDASGLAKVTYACNNASDAKCGQNTATIVTATWNTTKRGVAISLSSGTTPGGGGGGNSDAGSGTGGGSDAGTTATPVATEIGVIGLSSTYVIVSGAANAAQNLPGATTASAVVLDQDGKPMPGVTVAFAEASGESFVTVAPATSVTDAAGVASATVTGKAVPGTAHVTASVAGIKDPAEFVIPVIGGPSVITYKSAAPDLLLGLAGSGIQENGTMTFRVSDSLGTPVPNVLVNFTQAKPTLVALGTVSAAANAVGEATATYNALSEVGVTTLTATVVATNATATQRLAVRGAKPSAAGLFFRCEKANLAIYGVTIEEDSMTCTVALKDRSGNRVGISTPVAFATEAGAISAVAMTKPFDLNDLTDQDEGTATVTFTASVANGFMPLDVAPLAAAPAQISLARLNPEPAYTVNGVTRNPRDQLVTMIAMVRGEEAFVDTNHDGAFTAGEMFVDLSDPYIDANDNNTYDGAYEQRFCNVGNCSAFAGPNGTWDSDRIIWAPAWVVYSGNPAFGNGQTSMDWAGSNCVDYSDNTLSNESVIDGSVVVRDQWLNTMVFGTIYSAELETGATGLTYSGRVREEVDGYGAMGGMHLGFDSIRVSATDNTKPCDIANGNVCVMRTIFGDFDTGERIFVKIADANKLPAAASSTGGACPAPGTTGTAVGKFAVNTTVKTPTVTVKFGLSGLYGK